MHVVMPTLKTIAVTPEMKLPRRVSIAACCTVNVGGIMHVALAIDQERLDEIKHRLEQHRVKYQQIGGSLYLKDPNGLGIELMVSS